jgi:hypothetical protein
MAVNLVFLEGKLDGVFLVANFIKIWRDIINGRVFLAWGIK